MPAEPLPPAPATPDIGQLAAIALGHVGREFPNLIQHAMAGPDDLARPRHLHPAFHGSLDWHSCVHSTWLLAVAHRRGADAALDGRIAARLDAMLTPATIAGECAYFERPGARGFERPYGWAWLLALHRALEGTRWAAAVRPLAGLIAARLAAYLARATYPVRAGTHFNTAFALYLCAPWAALHDAPLLAALRRAAWDWYGADRACQAWEPSQDDFLSPALIEAVCLARLHPERFGPWFAAFLPGLGQGEPATLFRPVLATDRSDGKIAHLDGLNLSRAWCWRLLAPHLARPAPAEAAARAHLAASLPHLDTDYMGEHWLATYAALACWPDLA